MVVISLTTFKTQEGDDGNMVYVNEKGKVDISREGKFMSVMPPGKSLHYFNPFNGMENLLKMIIEIWLWL